MELTEAQAAFLAEHHQAAMITVTPDGTAKPARIGLALIDGKLWSSGTVDRTRTRRLRRNPRATLFVFDAQSKWLGIEAAVTLREGPDVPGDSVRLMRVMQGRPEGPIGWFNGELDEEAFRRQMIAENRIIYEFEPTRVYGLI